MSRVTVKHVRRNKPTATPVADGLAPCIECTGLLSPDIIAKVMLRELLIAIRQTQTLAYTEFITIFLLVKIARYPPKIFSSTSEAGVNTSNCFVPIEVLNAAVVLSLS